MKIGLYPGSYNPIHKGHMSIIKKLLKEKIVEKIILIPLDSYWKKNINVTLKNRIDMLKIHENKNIIVDGTSSNLYACEILDKYKKKYLNDDLYYIIGSDNLENIERWKKVDDVLKHKFIIVERPGYNSIELINIKKLNKENFIIIAFNSNISSTKIRNNLKENINVSSMVDKDTLNYIIKNNLYKE